jgi:hypothetical protein
MQTAMGDSGRSLLRAWSKASLAARAAIQKSTVRCGGTEPPFRMSARSGYPAQLAALSVTGQESREPVLRRAGNRLREIEGMRGLPWPVTAEMSLPN